MNKHLFSLFYEGLSFQIKSKNAGDCIVISDIAIFNRLQSILRLDVGDLFVLFDKRVHAYLEVYSYVKKKEIVAKIVEKSLNKSSKYTVKVLLPLVKKKALEEAIYSATELGANEVYLTITSKSSGKFFGDSDYQRLKNIVVAASEQSKHYSMCLVHMPQPLQTLLDQLSTQKSYKVFCDQSGKSLFSLLTKMNAEGIKHGITIMVGPEGDLVDYEKELLLNNQFNFYALTPTILRTQQALALIVGAIRSLREE